jgi:hypothetical protein
VSKAFRYPELKIIFRRKSNPGPLSESGRVSSEIDGNVEHPAMYYADKFSLWMSDLIMQTTQHTMN